MLNGEDHTKDIDFTREGIGMRWRAGYDDTRRVLDRSPWDTSVDPVEGVVIHEPLGAKVHIAEGVDGFEERTR
jgi:NTE family protein